MSSPEDSAPHDGAELAAATTEYVAAWRHYEEASIRTRPDTANGSTPTMEFAARFHDQLRGGRPFDLGCGRGHVPGELHICMGLNACKGFDVDRVADLAGVGECATVRHVCHGEGSCRAQGGCGYAGSDHEQFLPGAQACRFNGSCAVPINASRVFSTGAMKGRGVWQHARRLFEDRMYEAGLAFGPAPGNGVPDTLLPLYDVIDYGKDEINDLPITNSAES